MSRIVFIADVHIGNYTEFDVNGSRLDRCLNALEQVLQFAIKHDAVIVDAGDIFDKKNLIDFTVYNRAYQLLKKYGMTPDKLIALAGNHNHALRDGSVTNLEPLQDVMTVVDKPATFDLGGVVIWFIPYMRDLSQWLPLYKKACEDARKLKEAVPIFVGHQEITGALTGTHRYSAKDGITLETLPGPFAYALFGHYHYHQQLKPNVWYLGALLQQEFGEESNAQGFWYWDNGAWSWHSVQVPRFQTVEYMEHAEPGNYIRFRSADPGAGAVDLSDDQRPLVRVEPVLSTATGTRLDPAGFKSLDALVESYVMDKIPVENREGVRAIVRELRT